MHLARRRALGPERAGLTAAVPAKRNQGSKQMSLKKLGVALLAVFVLGAIAANSAFAKEEFKETTGQWYTRTVKEGEEGKPGNKLASGEENKITLNTEAVGEKQVLNTTVAGEPLEIEAKEVECSGCFIDVTISPLRATIDGILVFKKVKVLKPVGCSTTEKITSNLLSASLGMETVGTGATLKFVPKSGATFATVELTGGSCPIAGLYKVTGTAFGKATNATGVFALKQEVKVSKAIQESAGTATSLKFGENAATIEGALKGFLSNGAEWAGKES
jgi:hypothetical protein